MCIAENLKTLNKFAIKNANISCTCKWFEAKANVTILNMFETWQNKTTAVPHIRRCIGPPLIGLYEASYMRQGYKITNFSFLIFICIFSDNFVTGLYMKKFHDFSVGYRSMYVHCISWQLMFNFYQNFKLLLDNLPFHLFVNEFFPGELYKMVYIHCLTLDLGLMWGSGRKYCI